MPEFQPIRQLFECTGIDLLHPPDRMPPGKFPFLSNARSQQDTTLTSRPGYGAPLNSAPFDQLNVHSLKRVNNSIPGAAIPTRRFAGAGTKLFSVDSGLIDSGYSGNPLSLISWRPDQSTESWLYVGDSLRMQKCRLDVAQTHYNVGIAPPTSPPQVQGGVPLYAIVSECDNASSWVAGGTSGAISQVARDDGATTVGILAFNADPFLALSGWCNISPFNTSGNYKWIGVGARLVIGGGTATQETVTVNEVHTEVPSSTILAIQYDSGSGPGQCTIQAADPLHGLTRNSMVQLAGGETPVVLSVSVGPDGLYSFRCSTEFVQTAGATIVGVPCFRAYLAHSGHVITETITAASIKATISTGTGTLVLAGALDLSKAGAPPSTTAAPIRPLAPEDYLHISVLVDNPSNLTEGRILVDVDATTNDFQHNLYFLAFRPSDTTAALTGGQTALQALSTAATNLLIGEVVASVPAPRFVNATDPQLQPDATVPDSEQLFAGNSAWTEIRIPLSSLQRIGADGTRSIANVESIALTFTATGTINVQASAWWVGGTYGPDTFPPTAQPLLYRYRYRSTLTGAKSQQSPGTRANIVVAPDGTVAGFSSGAIAYRQQVLIYPSPSTDPQVDQIDIERFGGVLNEWHYAGTVPNASNTVFQDPYSDDELKTAPALETDCVMPFPSFDVPRKGTCNVIGTSVIWASGDHFSTIWAPGQEILINGVPYIVYGQPDSTTSLQTVENVGVLTGVPFLVAEPVLIGQPMPQLIGPFDQGNFLLAFGDPRNPGTVRATKGNDPDSAPIEYYLELSDPSEDLRGGVIWDNSAIVASRKRFWRVSIDQNAVATGQGNVLVKQELQVGHGIFTPWSICAGPQIWFLDESGVPCVTNGARAESIIENDLKPIFAHDGAPGVAVNGFLPPKVNTTTPALLRFAYGNGLVWFLYQDTGNTQRCMVYDPVKSGWWPWDWAVPMNIAYFAEGSNRMLLGGTDGNVYTIGGFSDNGSEIRVQVHSPYNNSGNPRTMKFYGDAMADIDPQGVDVSLTPTWDLGGVIGNSIPIQGNQRAQYPLDLQFAGGQLAHSVGCQVSWFSNAAAPVLYTWEPSGYDTGTVPRTSWVSLPASFGLNGWWHLRDGYLPLYIQQVGVVTLTVLIDNVAQGVYTFSPSPDMLQKLRVDFLPRKGLMYQFKLTSPTPFLLFGKDLEVNGKQWGSTGPYLNLKPFGDPEFA